MQTRSLEGGLGLSGQGLGVVEVLLLERRSRGPLPHRQEPAHPLAGEGHHEAEPGPLQPPAQRSLVEVVYATRPSERLRLRRGSMAPSRHLDHALESLEGGGRIAALTVNRCQGKEGFTGRLDLGSRLEQRLRQVRVSSAKLQFSHDIGHMGGAGTHSGDERLPSGQRQQGLGRIERSASPCELPTRLLQQHPAQHEPQTPRQAGRIWGLRQPA